MKIERRYSYQSPRYLGDWLTSFALALLLSHVKQQGGDRSNGDKIKREEYDHTLEPARDVAERKDRCSERCKKTKTYNSGYSLVVTHLTTNPPVRCLNRAERTGSLVFNVLWSYVLVL
jgi:hypothetical protein